MDIIRAHHPLGFRHLDTAELRRSYLISDGFHSGGISACYWETDRTVVGSAVPVAEELVLPNYPQLAARFFCERRELGIVNLGGPGSVEAGGEMHPLGPLDFLYVGRGTEKVAFRSAVADPPAQFYFVSYPAHRECPTVGMGHAAVEPLSLGSKEQANERKLFQMIIPGRVETCQLVMGFTRIEPGSVWNTMPAHTHERRSEVYLYFGLPDDAVAFHFMGEPAETRHLVVRNRQAVLSPSWSIHAGAGTAPYSFVWAMGGENQDFRDMDLAAMAGLK